MSGAGMPETADHEGVHTICGLSNTSYGLPERKPLNQLFVVMAEGNLKF
jgi:cobalamin-dependent methionine synthase I